MTARESLLVSPESLAAELDGPQPPIVLDVRYRLDRPDGSAEFATAHIPGARYVSLDEVFAGHGPATEGRHPLPSAEQLARELARLGVRSSNAVVTLDDFSGWAASRAWWVLGDAGFGSVRVLDGGWKAWQSAGLPVTNEPSHWVATEPEQLSLGQRPALSIDQAAERGQSGVLLDARAPERFRGETEPLDPKAGHIPGAQNLPVSRVFDGQGRFANSAQLAELFAGFDAGAPIGVYCGSGVSATPLVLALELAGYRAELFPGSWSAWSHQDDRPVAIGD